MSKITRKAQVVIAGFDAQSQSLRYLLMQTNQKRGAFWQNVTGKVEQGEPYPVGALREAMEETSLKVEWIVHFIDLNLAHNFIDERKRNVHEKSYLCLVDRTFDVTIDPHEHMAFRWKQKILRSDVKHLGNFEALECAQKLILENFT